jgi:hypothetical protein
MFATLTYRDMPFVTAPIFWKVLTSKNRKFAQPKERSHGDRLNIDYDSPEAFEEVFWMAFAGEDYIKKDWLEINEIGDGGIHAYRKFVNNVVLGSGQTDQTRYLSKNNNNLLRLHGLKRAFPHAIILLPFRNPMDQASSMHAQHKRFLNMHAGNPFSLRYMNWLGHHEFGLNFKPLMVSEEVIPRYKGEPETLAYWVRYWTCIYRYVLAHHISDVIPFDYDRFCMQPGESLRRLSESLLLEYSMIEGFPESVKPATGYAQNKMESSLVEDAESVYGYLKKGMQTI